MTTGQEDGGAEVAVRSYDPGLLAQFAEMATLIPAEDDDAMERILTQVLTAETWEQLDAPWDASKAEDLAGRVLRLNWAARRPSDYRDGLGMFLVLHCTDVRNGEEVTAVTGSVSVVGQVVRAYALGTLPLFIEFVVAKRPSQSGYLPHHLKIHGSDGSRAQHGQAPAAG